MHSILAWVDESPERMEAVRRYIKAMEQEGALDLLGFGSILERYSNIFFPAVSTIMTRARYYIFIPAVFKEIEHHKLSGSEAYDRLNKTENTIRDLLYQTDSSETGIIGRNAKEKINSFPSDIYWGGIRELGIYRNRKFSKHQYIKNLKDYYHYMDERTGGRQKDEEESYFEYSWDIDFNFKLHFEAMKTLNFKLDRKEADYLKKKFEIYSEDHGESVMTWLLNNTNDDIKSIDWPALHEMIIKSRTVSDDLKKHVKVAYRFRLVASCIEQIYYLMLSRKKYSEISSQHETAYNSLKSRLEDKDLRIFIKDSDNWLADAVKGDDHFFKSIIKELISADFETDTVIANKTVNNLIENRERTKKKHKARLTYSDALNGWHTDSPVSGYLDYRLYTGWDIAMDIIRGLNA